MGIAVSTIIAHAAKRVIFIILSPDRELFALREPFEVSHAGFEVKSLFVRAVGMTSKRCGPGAERRGRLSRKPQDSTQNHRKVH